MWCKACCQNLDESLFYESNKSRCKDCIKASVKKNRLEKIEYYRSYDRMRASQQHRVQARKEYRETEAYKYAHAKANQKYLLSEPKKKSARYTVSNAIRDGRLEKQPCFVCGQCAEAHHPDYDRPLDVVWLCDKHHKETHKMAREIDRERKAA